MDERKRKDVIFFINQNENGYDYLKYVKPEYREIVKNFFLEHDNRMDVIKDRLKYLNKNYLGAAVEFFLIHGKEDIETVFKENIPAEIKTDYEKENLLRYIRFIYRKFK